MAYTPKTWVCGETITDAGLNNIETGIQEALQGGGSSLPEVTSADDGKVLTVVNGEWDKADSESLPAVTSADDGKVLTVVDGEWAKADSESLPEVTSADNDMVLTVVDGEWVKADRGYKCVESGVIPLFEESVFAEDTGNGFAYGTLAYDEIIDAETLSVVFNGTTYVCDRVFIDAMPAYSYGGTFNQGICDFSEYPFIIQSVFDGTTLQANNFLVENEGTYSVKAGPQDITVETTECFEEAVKSVVGEVGYECVDGKNTIFDEAVTTTAHGSENYEVLAYSSDITLESVNITFDGVDYLNVPRTFDDEYQRWVYGETSYGSPLFRTYPFMIAMDIPNFPVRGNILYTETAGAHTVEAWTGERTVTTTECFREAVKSVSSPFVVNVATSGGVTALDKTWEEILDAFVAGISVLIKGENSPNQYSSVIGVHDGLSYDISDGSGNHYSTSSADGYPTLS